MARATDSHEMTELVHHVRCKWGIGRIGRCLLAFLAQVLVACGELYSLIGNGAGWNETSGTSLILGLPSAVAPAGPLCGCGSTHMTISAKNIERKQRVLVPGFDSEVSLGFPMCLRGLDRKGFVFPSQHPAMRSETTCANFRTLDRTS